MKLSLPYSDPLQLSETLNELGQLTRITQFDSGAGSYSMSHSMASGISIAEIKASKTLLYEGWGTDWSVDFNWITPLKNSVAPMGLCEGYEMKANSIGGLNTYNGSPGGSWGKYSPLCSSTLSSVLFSVCPLVCSDFNFIYLLLHFQFCMLF